MMSTGRICGWMEVGSVLAVIFVFAAVAAGGVTYWQHSPAMPGEWFDPANWTAGLPGSSDIAIVDNGGTVLYGTGYAGVDELSLTGIAGGEIIHSGGTLRMYTWVRICSDMPGSARYELVGGLLKSNSAWVGDSAGAWGVFDHSAGVHEGDEITVNYRGTYHLSGAALVETQLLRVHSRDGQSGRFEQIGGRVLADRVTLLGKPGQPGGIYSLVDGEMTTHLLEVGHLDDQRWRGNMEQSGGAATADRVGINPISVYSLMGGSLRVTKMLEVDGELDLGGSAATVTIGELGWADFSQGAVTGGTAASFVAGPDAVVWHAPAFNPAECFGTFHVDGIVHEVGTDLVVPAGGRVHFPYDRTVSDHVICHGEIYNDGSQSRVRLIGGIELFDGGHVEVHPGIVVEDTVSGMSGGEIVGGGLRVAEMGVGVFTHTGGQCRANGISIGRAPGSDGHYVLNGPKAVVDVVGISVGCGPATGPPGGTGRFTQLAGSVTCDGVTVGKAAGQGTYDMQAGTLEVSYTNVGDTYGYGEFLLSGGHHTIRGKLNIGKFHGTGIYRITGGRLDVRYLVTGAYTGDGTFEAVGGVVAAGCIYVGGESSLAGRLMLSDAGAKVTATESLTFCTKGSLQAVPSATIRMTGADFQNESHDPAALAGLNNLTLIFDGGNENLCTLEVAGEDLGQALNGFELNFALDRLKIGHGRNAARVQLLDLFDNQPNWSGKEALYVKHLLVGRECYLDLDGLNLYYLEGHVHPHAEIVGGTPTRIEPQWLADLGQIESTAVPEPATLALLGLGGLAIMRRRRRG